MYFPRSAEYALRAMAHMARLPVGQAARAQELSEAADIPTPYLSKILRKLVLASLLKSKKGHGGGFVLARPAGEIRFLDILGAAEYETDPAECAFGWGECDPNYPCPLHPAWARLRDSFLEWAAGLSLADVRDAPYLPRGLESLGPPRPEVAAARAALKVRREADPIREPNAAKAGKRAARSAKTPATRPKKKPTTKPRRA